MSTIENIPVTYQPLTDAEWVAIAPILRLKFVKNGKQSTVNDRAAVDAVLHVLTTKCGWKGMPNRPGYPSRPTAERRFVTWRDSGALTLALDTLTTGGRDAPTLTVALPRPEKGMRGEKWHSFGGDENLQLMVEAGRARMLAGQRADWKIEE